MELSVLGDHLSACHASRGRLFSLRCAAERLHGHVAPRFVTTLLLAALLIGLGCLW